MPPLSQWKSQIDSLPFAALYGGRAAAQPARYAALLDAFSGTFGDRPDVSLFSVPGRTEIGGNHTDHNHGRVLAGAVNLDIIAAAAPNRDGVVRLHSAGHKPNCVELDTLAIHESEKGRSNAVIRGICARFAELGLPIGGFDAVTASNVLTGSGLSSSAAFEVMVCTMLDCLYGDGNLPPLTKAIISRYAENVYFGKPCGLMDQTACAYGGLIAIDFNDIDNPVVTPVPFDFAATGHALCIVNTGGSHADLTPEYAAVPEEMRAVAEALGTTHLRRTGPDALLAAVPALRTQTGDRALLRALHFFGDNQRVARQVSALLSGAFTPFLAEVAASGRSSWMYNQNVAVPGSREQGVALGLCLAEKILDGSGATRVHGGGFAGTIQAFVPEGKLSEFRAMMESVFGEGSCLDLTIRQAGAVRLG
jgi:galactokinase